MKVEVQKINGEKTGKKVDLNKEIYQIEPSDHAIYLDVKHYNASQRQGTAASRHRGIIKGSTRKIKKQKGTGTARAGSIKSPLFRGGGRIFGPEPRDYSFKLNKKLKKLARRSALSYKAQNKNIIVVEDFKMDAPKTADYLNILGQLELSDKKTLLVTADIDNNVYLSSRNLQGTKVVRASDLNTYDILNAQSLLLCEGALGIIENQLAS